MIPFTPITYPSTPKVHPGVTPAFSPWQTAPELMNGRNVLDISTRYITGITHIDSITNSIAAVPGKQPMTRDQIVNKIIADGFAPPKLKHFNTHKVKAAYINGYINYAIENGFLAEA